MRLKGHQPAMREAGSGREARRLRQTLPERGVGVGNGVMGEAGVAASQPSKNKTKARAQLGPACDAAGPGCQIDFLGKMGKTTWMSWWRSSWWGFIPTRALVGGGEK